MVHRRELNGTALVLGNQGALWGNAMTWWDHDTGSVWSQPIGEAILGPRKGARLELLPSTLTSWRAWQVDHPDTLALDAPGGRGRFALSQMALVVDFGSETTAYFIPDVARVGAVNDTVAGVDLAVIVDRDRDGTWVVFSRRLDETVVVLDLVDGTLVDRITGSTFDAVRGVGASGPLADQTLDQLPAFTAFPKDIGTFWPQARFFEP